MASSGKKKTTMAKLNRERKLRERRIDKQAKKDARKQAPHQHEQFGDGFTSTEVPSDPRESESRFTASDPPVRTPAEA